jgi:hypothetical protein
MVFRALPLASTASCACSVDQADRLIDGEGDQHDDQDHDTDAHRDGPEEEFDHDLLCVLRDEDRQQRGPEQKSDKSPGDPGCVLRLGGGNYLLDRIQV